VYKGKTYSLQREKVRKSFGNHDMILQLKSTNRKAREKQPEAPTLGPWGFADAKATTISKPGRPGNRVADLAAE
jgi:hypothetical protein